MKPEQSRIPADPDLEYALVGGCILFPEHLDVVRSQVSVDDFYSSAAAVIFQVLEHLHDNNQTISAEIVLAELTAQGALDRIGGKDMFFTIVENASPEAVIGTLPQKVAQYSKLRQLQSQLYSLWEMTAGYGDPAILLDECYSALSQFDTSIPIYDKPLSMKEHVQQYLEELNQRCTTTHRIRGISWGIEQLDAITGGLRKRNVAVVAGRPGMGKTAFLLSVARNAAWHEKVPVYFFSLEMSTHDLLDRIFSAAARVPIYQLTSGKIGDTEWANVLACYPWLQNIPLWICDLRQMDVGKMKRYIKEAGGEYGLICIDYLQLLSPSQHAQGRSRQEEITQISREVRQLAADVDMPVLAAAQLNRAPEVRADHRPLLADLRESGTIEQDADLVLLLYREGYYDRTKDPSQCLIDVAKHRNGPRLDITVRFSAEKMLFY